MAGRYGGAVPKEPAASASLSGGLGSRRARLRLIAVVLLGGLTVLYLVFAIRLSFLPAVTGILGIAFAVAALGYGLLARAVAKQSRGGHITAVVVTVIGAILAVSAGMEWLDWLVLAANLAAFGVLLGCVPRRR